MIKEEIDGKPAQAHVVSAILMGTSLVVPKGGDVGGDFKSIPLCHSATQTGCVIAFASFRETSPPPGQLPLCGRAARGSAPPRAWPAACVNPASSQRRLAARCIPTWAPARSMVVEGAGAPA